MLRKASIWYPSDVHALYFEKYKGNYGEFLKDKNVLLCTRLYKYAPENSILKFLIVSSVSSDSIVKGIIDDIIKTAVKTAEVDEQKTKYLQHFVNKHDTIVSK
jgi:hypothetical protein